MNLYSFSAALVLPVLSPVQNKMKENTYILNERAPNVYVVEY